MSNRYEQKLHISLYIIFYKLFLGLFELILGLGILIWGKKILDIYESLKAQELLEDPHDILIKIAQSLLPYILQHRGYIILILIVLGIVKIVGSIGLFYHKHWGLDLLVGLTFIVLPFEFFNLIFSLSLSKVLFFIANIFIALYLVEFQPKDYYTNFKKRVLKNKV